LKMAYNVFCLYFLTRTVFNFGFIAIKFSKIAIRDWIQKKVFVSDIRKVEAHQSSERLGTDRYMNEREDSRWDVLREGVIRDVFT